MEVRRNGTISERLCQKDLCLLAAPANAYARGVRGLLLHSSYAPRNIRAPSRLPTHSMSGRKSILLIALLAVVLNVLSAPIAWARMSAGMDHAPTSTISGTGHCAGEENATNSKQPSSPRGDHASCCKGGPCTCGCLPAAVVAVPRVPRISVAPQSAEAQAFVAVPPEPVEDPLRPPIS